jgi:hypothetical protein
MKAKETFGHRLGQGVSTEAESKSRLSKRQSELQQYYCHHFGVIPLNL